MKAIVADYRYRVLCMKIVPKTGTPVYLTDHVTDLTMSGHTYLSTSGYQFTGNSSTAGFTPSNIDIEGIVGLAGITRATVSSGVFDGARCYCFATSWVAPVEDQEPITAGVFGKTTILDDKYVINGTSMIDALNQTVGATYSVQCPKKFGGTEYAGCGVNLAFQTEMGTLTGVSSARVFSDGTRPETSGVFQAGTIEFLTGPNAGLKPLEIKSFTVPGIIETHEAFYYMPVIGNQYRIIRGCLKRSIDCKNRWDGFTTYSNMVNFGGFEYIPTGSVYAQRGTN
jgi:uncharacterized phage protein (TIGR02218 family)